MTKFSDPSLAAGWGYPILLVVLLGTFAVQPWAAQTVIGTTFVGLTYSSVLIGALIVLSRHRLLVAVGILLTVPATILGNLAGAASDGRGVLGNGLALVFLLIVIVLLLRDVFNHPVVTVRTISGAICVFLLIGLAWIFMYDIADWFAPNAFDGLSARGGAQRPSELFYFSFVTLTTLGYGDITPIRPETMSLATLEAVVGQLYLIVLIATLVGRRAETKGAEGKRRPTREPHTNSHP